MKIIYEKEVTEGDKTYYVECPESEATHTHYCYNEEGKPCKREPKSI